MNLKLNPLSVLRILSWTILFLLIANILAIGIKLNSNSTAVVGAAALFDFNTEANIPTLYSALALLGCSVLLFYIYWAKSLKDEAAKQWLGLSAIFLFLTIDEIGSIHERIMPLMHDAFELSGIFYYAWIIPYGIALVLLATIYLPFVLKLPKNIKHLFLAAGILYVGGAMGVEILGGQQDERYGTYNLAYSIYYTIEELLEMVGIALFIYALLLYIEEFSGFEQLKLKIDSSTTNTEKLQFRSAKKM